MKTVAIDTNIILRLLLADHPTLHIQAKEIFSQAETGKHKIYLDEVIVAEAVWVLGTFYKQPKAKIASPLIQLISQPWVVNPRKKLILKSLDMFSSKNLNYIDCWFLCLSKSQGFMLETLDRKLHQFASRLETVI